MPRIPPRDRDQRRIAPIPMDMPEAWTNLTLLNSYVAKGTQDPSYLRDIEGFVNLRGGVKNGTTNAAAATLPAGYRPNKDQFFHEQGIKIDAAGNITPIRGVYAEYTQGGAVGLTNGTHNRLDFPTLVKDTHSAVTTGASWAFTAPVAGFYLVTGRVSVNSTAAQHTILAALFKNGAQHRQGERLIKPAVAGFWGALLSVQVELAAGDTLYMTCFVDAVGQNTEGAVQANWICISQMGELPLINEFTLDGIRFDPRA